MKRVDINALRGLANMPSGEMEQKLADMLQKSGNGALAGKINASAIDQLKRQLTSMDQSQLDALVSQMQNIDSGTLQKLRNMLNK